MERPEPKPGPPVTNLLLVEGALIVGAYPEKQHVFARTIHIASPGVEGNILPQGELTNESV